jgi:N,N'-diacetyllegionaminate synthase
MKIEIIAELAQGFEGSLTQTKLLVKAAAKAGADAAKFQLVYANELATSDYEYYELFSNLEMSNKDWHEIKMDCDKFGIELIFDVFGELGLALAQKLKVQTVKLHATDINNIGFLNSLAQSSVDRVLLGAGGAYSEEIKNAIEILSNKKIVLFHGFQGYPTSINDNQISRLKIWKSTFGEHTNVSFGFSDHADPMSPSGVTLPALAIGYGALILEKHLTLGACMELEDYESAMNPDQFKTFVESIKDITIASGISVPDNKFGMSQAEAQYRKNIRRHVVISQDMNVGDIIKENDVVLKRTSADNSFTDIQSIYGKKVIRALEKNSPITEEDIN